MGLFNRKYRLRHFEPLMRKYNLRVFLDYGHRIVITVYDGKGNESRLLDVYTQEKESNDDLVDRVYRATVDLLGTHSVLTHIQSFLNKN